MAIGAYCRRRLSYYCVLATALHLVLSYILLLHTLLLTPLLKVLAAAIV